MAQVALNFDGQISVLSHAVDQTQARDSLVAGMVRREVRQSIVDRVALAISRGRVHDTKPRGFGLSYGKGLPPWHRFVVDASGAVGWVVSLDEPPDVVVVTCLTRLPRVVL